MKFEIKYDEFKVMFKDVAQKNKSAMERKHLYVAKILGEIDDSARNREIINMTNASIVEAIISVISSKALLIRKNEKNQEYIVINFFMKIITSHISIFSDYEFFNVALVLRYLIEATTALMDNKEDLNGYFQNISGENLEKELLKWNGKITPKIKKILGEEYAFIYKKLSGFIHPGNGSFYMISPTGVAKRTEFIIVSSIDIYIKCAIEVFKLLGHELIINWKEYAIHGVKLAWEQAKTSNT